MQTPILSGIFSDESSDFRTKYPRNMVPVAKKTGISDGYLRPADGAVAVGTGPGIGRGGINWNGALYRVMGTKLVRIGSGGAVSILGDVGMGGPVQFDYSPDRLAIASAQHLFYWNGTTLVQVTDPDLGVVVDMLWVDGYFMTTDGNFIVVTDINDPMSVNPLKYGSSESDPDPIMALRKVRKEILALNRYTTEFFQNVGGTGFPFSRIDGALVQKGAIGTRACANFLESVAFVGSGRNEAPSVYLAQGGAAAKIGTREIDIILAEYSEADLSTIVMEARFDRGHQHLLIRLPDQTLVFDGVASAIAGDSVWFTLTSSVTGKKNYRPQNLVWAYDGWQCEDSQSATLGTMSDAVSTHFGETVGWEFGTAILYNESNGVVIHDLELVGLPGHAALGIDPTIWTSYSLDGETWSQEKAIHAGKQGQRTKRLVWRRQGHMRNYRIQQFRGTSDTRISFARLEMTVEPLNG
jgi:Phage stabilisation protein